MKRGGEKTSPRPHDQAKQLGCIARHDERTAEACTRAQAPQDCRENQLGGGINLRRALAAEAACESEVLGLTFEGKMSHRSASHKDYIHSDTLSVDSGQVGVFEEGDEVG